MYNATLNLLCFSPGLKASQMSHFGKPEIFLAETDSTDAPGFMTTICKPFWALLRALGLEHCGGIGEGPWEFQTGDVGSRWLQMSCVTLNNVRLFLDRYSVICKVRRLDILTKYVFCFSIFYMPEAKKNL